MPDGRYMIIAVEESDSTVGFYDSFNGDEVGRVAVGRWPHEIEVSADGTMAYVTNFGIKDYDENIGTPGESVSVIDLRTLCEVDRLFTFRNKDELNQWRAPHGVKLSPNGTRLYVNVERGDKMLVYDLTDTTKKTPADVLEMHSDRAAVDSLPDEVFGVPERTHNFIFSTEGEHLFVASGPRGMTKMRVKTGTIEATLVRAGSAIRGVTYTPDKRHLIVSGSGELCLVDPSSLKVVQEFKGLGVRQLLYSQPTLNGKHVIAPAVWEGQLLLIDAERGRVVRRLVVGADPIHVAITPDGETAYVSHGRSRYLSVIDINRFREVRRIRTRGGPNGIALAPLPVLPQKRTIKVGACIPLSGVSTSEGQDLRLGYQFWQETVNAAGGMTIGGERYDVEVIFRDSRSETSEGLLRRLTEELIDEEEAEFVFGGYPSPPNEHSGRVADERKIPFITASGAAGRIYEQGFEYVFGIMTSAQSFLTPLFDYLATLKVNKPQSALFISCNDPAASQDARTTAKNISDAGLRVSVPSGTGLPEIEKVLHYSHLQDASAESLRKLKESYRAVLTKAVGPEMPDVLVHTGHLPEAVALVQVASEMNYVPKGIAFSVGPALPDFAIQLDQITEGLAENLLGAAMWTSEQPEAGHDRFVTPKAFARAFFDRFSKRESYLSAGAVACGVVLEDAIRRAKTKEPMAVRDALRSMSLYTFYSKIEFNAKGLNEMRPLVMIQLRTVDREVLHVPLWPRELASGNEAVWPFPGWPRKDQTFKRNSQSTHKSVAPMADKECSESTRSNLRSLGD